MKTHVQHRPAKRLLVVMPNSVSDCVLAMPTLRALRELYPQTHMVALVRDTIKGTIEGCPWLNQFITFRLRARSAKPRRRRGGPIRLGRRIASMKFDTAVLLSDSFRLTLLARMAGVKRCVGYDCDGRGFLLTERILPRRHTRGFVPVSRRDYYLGLARYLGATNPDPALCLFTRSEDEAEADRLLSGPMFAGRRLVLIAPGSSHGDAKRWPMERFAELADLCYQQFDAAIGVVASGDEREVVDRLLTAARSPVIDLQRHGLNLPLLKCLIRRSSLVISNDTGPRHIAAAMNVPVVTIFGPTDPKWTETRYHRERKISVQVFCGPCHRKQCPLLDAAGRPDHRCMKLIGTDMVFAAAVELMAASAPASTH